MKKLLGLVVMIALSISSYAITLNRETAPLGYAGTSTVSVCNSSFCTVPTGVSIGSSYSNPLARIISIVITFDYAFYPGAPSTFYVDPATVIAAGGSYVTYYGTGCDVLKIRYLGGDTYGYQVYTTCL